MQTTTKKTEFIGYLILGEIKRCNLKDVHLQKKSKPVKKHNSFTFHYYLVALKIETGFELQEY